jgi:glycosyltransferase involved in cell wall biosynthesis
LEACQILYQQKRSFELLVLGDGPERASLEVLAQEWQLTSQVRFLGRVAQSHMPELLSNADLVVVPSLGGEVFGMVPAENMLRGVPVLASNLGAFDEVLGDAGITFKTGDPADLARQIVRILDDPSLSNRMRVTGRLRAIDRFPMSRMIDRHTEIYRRLASKKGVEARLSTRNREKTNFTTKGEPPTLD